MTALWQDVRFGARLLVKDKWVTLAAMTALAVGIGVNNTAFTLVNAVLLRPLPFPHADRIMSLGTRDERRRDLGVSISDFEDWRASARSFDSLAIAFVGLFNINDDPGAPEQYQLGAVSSQFFGLLQQRPLVGRDFRPDDDQPSAPPTVIISASLWKSRYGSDPNIVGKTIRGNGLVPTVIGVMPEGMKFPFNTDVWMPFAHLAPAVRIERRDARNFIGFARLKEDVSAAQATVELNTIGRRLSQQYADTNKDMVPTMMPFADRITAGPIRTSFLALLGAVAFVLLIACANVANLLLVRSADRVKEIGIRVALGATRWHIVRQLLVESVLLSIISGMAGFGLSMIGIRWFDAESQSIGKPSWIAFTMDWRVFLMFAVVCLATGILFGMAPALHASTTNVEEVLKEGGGRSAAGSRRARRWTAVLVVCELALTVLLLTGAGLMIRSFLTLYTTDIGVKTEQILTAQVLLPVRQYPTVEGRRLFLSQLEDRLDMLPPSQIAAVASNLPFGGGSLRSVIVDGASQVDTTLPAVTTITIGARYFDALGIPLTRGRPLSGLDGTPGHEAAIVNQRFAAMLFRGGDPLGRRIRLKLPQGTLPVPGTSQEIVATIVGVAPTIRQRSYQDVQPDPVVYLPLTVDPPRGITFMIRSSGNAAALSPVLRSNVQMLDSGLPLVAMMTLDQFLAQLRWSSRVFGTMFAVFAGIALLLAAIGLYSVTAYSIAQRTREIGVRLALGAQPRQIGWLVARRALVQVMVGLAIGLAGAFAVGRVLQSILVQTSSRDPLTLMSIVALLVVVAVVACYWPTRCAARLDPAVALRRE